MEDLRRKYQLSRSLHSGGSSRMAVVSGIIRERNATTHKRREPEAPPSTPEATSDTEVGGNSTDKDVIPGCVICGQSVAVFSATGCGHRLYCGLCHDRVRTGAMMIGMRLTDLACPRCGVRIVDIVKAF